MNEEVAFKLETIPLPVLSAYDNLITVCGLEHARMHDFERRAMAYLMESMDRMILGLPPRRRPSEGEKGAK